MERLDWVARVSKIRGLNGVCPVYGVNSVFLASATMGLTPAQ